MMEVSKSKYKIFKNCPRSLWLLLNKPELAKKDPTAEKHIQDGIEVGKCAKEYFEDTFDVTSYDNDGALDIKEMIGKTNRALMDGNIQTIAEASFSTNELFCSVDLLHRNGNAFDIYEVKATTHVEDDHRIDAAFQKYVLEQRGLKVNKVYILHLNSNYIRHGDLDIHALLIAEDITLDTKFLVTYEQINGDLQDIQSIFKINVEPFVLLATRCSECPFKEYCHRDVPVPSVLNINGLKNKYEYFNNGIVSYMDVMFHGLKLNPRQKIQIFTFLNDNKTYIDVKVVKNFLKGITYPIYHLDFETIMPAIPPTDGTWPYEQIPTQYSLHIEYEDGRLEHKEFLGNTIDPRRAIAESLCNDIPDNVCVLAYNKSFECGRLEELSDLYPDLKGHLLKIRDNVIDLIIPFKSGAYYHPDMGGSNSIKQVLPALCPDDPELDYHALPVVHNGAEAMDIYPKMLKSDPVEKERIREGLLKYCCLDTLAMVKILQRLKETVR